MHIYDSCKSAIAACLETKTFAIAWLYNGEKTMGIHVHDCHEIYFSISGGEQFLIDNRVYEFGQGDIFFINPFESHYLSRIDQTTHERIVVSVYPDYLKRFSTPQTDLSRCFTDRTASFGHKITLTEEERSRFLYCIHKLSERWDYGQDVLDQSAFLELMTYLNAVFLSRCSQTQRNLPDNSGADVERRRAQTDRILSYINQHLAEELSISVLAEHFYLSKSYLCKIFKDGTGTTINRYITAKRITRAKALLAEGHSVTETGVLCGFGDYSNFLKTFTKIVGISPKKYASYEH